MSVAGVSDDRVLVMLTSFGHKYASNLIILIFIRSNQ